MQQIVYNTWLFKWAKKREFKFWILSKEEMRLSKQVCYSDMCINVSSTNMTEFKKIQTIDPMELYLYIPPDEHATLDKILNI